MEYYSVVCLDLQLKSTGTSSRGVERDKATPITPSREEDCDNKRHI